MAAGGHEEHCRSPASSEMPPKRATVSCGDGRPLADGDRQFVGPYGVDIVPRYLRAIAVTLRFVLVRQAS